MKHTLRVMKSSTTPWFKAKKKWTVFSKPIIRRCGVYFLQHVDLF